jgi:hypothetical protein
MSVLTVEEHALLLEAVDAHRPDLRPLVAELVVGDRRLAAWEGNALREAVGDDLAQPGFDEEYEPTARGRALEDLIDKLGRVTAVFD